MKFIFVVCLAFSIPVFAGNHAIFMGGAESAGEDPQFDREFGMLSTMLDQKKWDVQFLYKYKAQKTEAFTPENFRKQKDLLIRKIQNQEIKPGDQLLVYIGTHGYPNKDNETHKVSALNSMQVNLDELKEIVRAAEEKGVKLAIVDQSCYSGNIQNFATEKTCVLSGSTKGNSGYMDFSEKLAFLLQNSIRKEKNKVNLEEIFIEARLGSSSPAQPQISTMPGIYAGLFTENFENALVYQENIQKRDKFNCTYETLKQSEDLKEIRWAALKSVIQDKKLFDELDLDIAMAHATRKQLLQHIEANKRIESSDLQVCEEVETQKNPQGGSWSVMQCLNVDELRNIDEEILILEKNIKSMKPGKDQKSAIEHLAFLKRAKKSPDYAEKLATLKKTGSGLMRSGDFNYGVTALASQERAIYQKLYKYFDKTYPSKNACREFILN